MTMNPNVHVIGIVAVTLLLLMVPITVHGQIEMPPPLFDHQEFLLAQDQELRELAPDLTFGERVAFFVQDVREAFTFDPIARAELKLQHAEQHQQAIDNLDSRGLAIPIEFEERRIDKLNEVSAILNERLQDTPAVADERITAIIESFEILRTMAELNDIRLLTSQLQTVANSDQQTKERFNAKVNALKTWQENCTGDFDIDAVLPLRTAIDRIEEQCPKLLELQEQFGRERLRLLVTGQV